MWRCYVAFALNPCFHGAAGEPGALCRLRCRAQGKRLFGCLPVVRPLGPAWGAAGACAGVRVHAPEPACVRGSGFSGLVAVGPLGVATREKCFRAACGACPSGWAAGGGGRVWGRARHGACVPKCCGRSGGGFASRCPLFSGTCQAWLGNHCFWKRRGSNFSGLVLNQALRVPMVAPNPLCCGELT